MFHTILITIALSGRVDVQWLSPVSGDREGFVVVVNRATDTFPFFRIMSSGRWRIRREKIRLSAIEFAFHFPKHRAKSYVVTRYHRAREPEQVRTAAAISERSRMEEISAPLISNWPRVISGGENT